MQQELDRLLKQRIVPLIGPIDDELAKSVIAMMLYLHDLDGSRPLTLLIHSDGGLASSSLAIVDLIRQHSNPTHTVARHQARGMAAVILACGAKGHRRIGKHALIALSPLTAPRETPQLAAEMARIQDELTEILASCTRQTRDTIRADSLTGRMLNAESAIAYGLADEILPE